MPQPTATVVDVGVGALVETAPPQWDTTGDFWVVGFWKNIFPFTREHRHSSVIKCALFFVMCRCGRTNPLPSHTHTPVEKGRSRRPPWQRQVLQAGSNRLPKLRGWEGLWLALDTSGLWTSRSG